jgi:tRNA nucleotidyltransferase/poly(A) polymerase
MQSIAELREVLALDIARKLRANGYKAYLVGGCVRDRLLGITPKDFDIATDAPAAHVLALFEGSEPVGAHFGVVLVKGGDDVHVEVATFRSEGSYADGRHPLAVSFEKDPALDALRRDFSINGLMQDPFSGEVLDFVGGRADLNRRMVRAIGVPEQRFTEDHLRMLRAVRFAARLRFSIDPATMGAIQKLAPTILKTSAERIREELVRILTEGGARCGMELLDESGLLGCILPEVKAFQGVAQPPEFHPEGDVWQHILLMLDNLGEATPTLALGVVLHDVGKPVTFRRAPDRIRFDGHAEAGALIAKAILCRLKFPTSDIERVVSLVANHMRFKDVRQMRLSTLKRFLCLPHFEEHLELHRLDCLASNGYTDSYEYVKEKLGEFSADELQPPRLLTGRDLIRAGYQPGPAFGRALEAAETAQLEGQIHTPEEALAIARAVLDRSAV